MTVPAAAAPASGGQIYVIQGISGATLDVQVDGKVVLADAPAKRIVGPVAVGAGTHTVTVGSGSSAVTSDVAVDAGESVDVVAHPGVTAGDKPEITAFANDLAAVAPGKLRLAVAHTAAAPPADITVDGDVLFSNVANAEALSVVVPGGSYSVAIVPSATKGDPILGPVDLAVKSGTLTRVFAIGDVSKGTMDAVVHQLAVKVSGAAAPSSVQTGDGGQAATQFTSASMSEGFGWSQAGWGLLIVAAAATISRLATRRRASATAPRL